MSHSLRARVMRWPSADAARIGDADVKVYTASLLADAAQLERAFAMLSRSERDRFSGYSNDVVARRFAIGRATLREMLGALLSENPASVRLVDGQFGKPALARGAASAPLWFSVAHCEDLFLVALSRAGEVGVDVERTRAIECWERVADRTLAPMERAQLLVAVEHGEGADRVFLRHWCRVEAELKAIGCGIHGIEAHRAGERPEGLRVADLPELPLPPDLAAEAMRYQAAVALCAPSASARHATRATSQQNSPSAAPARASTP
jgi:4'-phosphopantetheinyl transferase